MSIVTDIAVELNPFVVVRIYYSEVSGAGLCYNYYCSFKFFSTTTAQRRKESSYKVIRKHLQLDYSYGFRLESQADRSARSVEPPVRSGSTKRADARRLS